MKPLLDPIIERKIQELSRRLGDYRKEHGLGSHPPREIWNDAVALCERAPLSRVALAIGVSVNGLRNRKKEIRRPTKKVHEPPQARFLEIRGLGAAVSLPPPARPHRGPTQESDGSRQVELTRSDGNSLRITDLEAHGIDLRTFIQGFMGTCIAPSQMEGGFR